MGCSPSRIVRNSAYPPTTSGGVALAVTVCHFEFGPPRHHRVELALIGTEEADLRGKQHGVVGHGCALLVARAARAVRRNEVQVSTGHFSVVRWLRGLRLRGAAGGPSGGGSCVR